MTLARKWRLAGATATGLLVTTATVAIAAASPKTVTGAVIKPTPGTPKPGTAVPEKDLGARVFVDSRYGYALAALDQAQFPASTSDGGKSWHLAGPALHVDAAQAPLTVLHIGAATPSVAYAYGGGQAVDTTSTGGTVWHRTLFNGLVEAVEVNFQRHLVAYVQLQAGSPVQQWVSKNGGISWTETTALFGG